MVKLEKDVDAKLPTKAKNTDIDTMNALMTSNILMDDSDQCTSLGMLGCGVCILLPLFIIKL